MKTKRILMSVLGVIVGGISVGFFKLAAFPFQFWAPDVYKIGERYIMTYSAEEHICYAEADSPCGPFVQSEKRPYLPNEKGIDSSFFIDDDGTPYIFWVRFTYGNVIWVAEMSRDLREVKLETARRLIDVEEGTWEHRQARVAEM